jgi:hypothetical protein
MVFSSNKDLVGLQQIQILMGRESKLILIKRLSNIKLAYNHQFANNKFEYLEIVHQASNLIDS